MKQPAYSHSSLLNENELLELGSIPADLSAFSSSDKEKLSNRVPLNGISNHVSLGLKSRRSKHSSRLAFLGSDSDYIPLLSKGLVDVPPASGQQRTATVPSHKFFKTTDGCAELAGCTNCSECFGFDEECQVCEEEVLG